MDEPGLFADVLLPLPVQGLFTYRIPPELAALAGKWRRVVVQFGPKKIYSAVVVRMHHNPPAAARVKNILSVLDEEPVMNDIQYDLWQWMSSYYMCKPGEVMNVAMPSALKLASETRITLNPAFTGFYENLNEKELEVANALDIHKRMTVTQLSRIIGLKKMLPLLKTLIEKGVISPEENLSDKYAPVKEIFVRLGEGFEDEEKLHSLFDRLEKKAPRQLEILMAYLKLSGFYGDRVAEVKKKDLLGADQRLAGAFKGLLKKGVFITYEKIKSRLSSDKAGLSPETITLSSHQQKAFEEIKSGFGQDKPVLLFGVTSSGKTEIYIKLIAETLRMGKQVLYLLPEIALTTQIIDRLRKYFGERVGVYHSRYNEAERYEIWKNVLSSRGSAGGAPDYRVILGPRSALFLPFGDLGLVIVDEEHDQSFKQIEPPPRYNARDSAIYLARLHGAQVILGSATPALESYFNAVSGKYALVGLDKRFGDVELPEIMVADVREETRRRTMKTHFSSLLLKHMEEAFARQEQVILFQNRRGFSLRLECDVCHWMPQCRHCDVTLIYHKQNNQLRCHYCGYAIRVPSVCGACGSPMMKMKGFGTEKVEEELSLIFPQVRISRMDLDSTRTKHAYHRILNDFAERRVDVLVGTQMVTKGLDFDHVSLVGILNADNMISFPDFRAFERSFQLMSQVSGRAGRKNKRGKVIIQTYNPSQSVIVYVRDNDYKGMYAQQIVERNRFKYPPFCRLIQLRLSHIDPKYLDDAALAMAGMLRKRLQSPVLGPEYPLVSRIKNRFIKHILIKIDRASNLVQAKNTLLKAVDDFYSKHPFRSVLVQLDVDPV
jgi:primosomal protein N' (replication factor Y)